LLVAAQAGMTAVCPARPATVDVMVELVVGARRWRVMVVATRAVAMPALRRPGDAAPPLPVFDRGAAARLPRPTARGDDRRRSH